MFARVQTFHQPAEKLEELGGLAQQQLTAETPGGLEGFYYLVDRDNQKALLISLWDTEENLRRLEASNAATRERVEGQTGAEVPVAEVFEVVLPAS